MEAWGLKFLEGLFTNGVADSLHFYEDMRILIGIKVKRWIRIRINVMRIRNAVDRCWLNIYLRDPQQFSMLRIRLVCKWHTDTGILMFFFKLHRGYVYFFYTYVLAKCLCLCFFWLADFFFKLPIWIIVDQELTAGYVSVTKGLDLS